MVLTEKKEINKIAFLFMFTYMISYMTRINYGAVILSMQEATRFSAAALSMAVTGSFITYGIGQVISGIIGDKYSPKKLIFFGLGVTVIMNLCIPFCPSPVWMTAVWCINGFAQALMWPPMVRLMTVLYTPETYKKITVRVSWGSCLGTVFVYLFAPLLITVSGWRSVFFFCTACGIMMAVIWKKMCPEVGRVRTVKTESGQKGSGLFAPMMLIIMLAVVAQGALRDSVTTWMPTYISDTYNMGSAVSILTGAVLPLFSILSFQLAAALHEKLRNPVGCAAVIFVLATMAAVALWLCAGVSPVISVLCFTLLIGAVHGVNLMLISMLPPFFAKYGNVSTASGVLNACAYVGSAVSTYGVAVISDKAGWNATLWTWILIAALGTACCLGCIRPWKRKHG